MKVLVTGGAGFIGRRVAFWLATRGYTVHVMDLAKPLLEPNLQTLYAQAIPFTGVGNLSYMPEYDAVVHCGAVCDTRNGDPDELIRTNYDLTVELYRRVKAGLFVFFSSAGVYGDTEAHPLIAQSFLVPKTRYAVSKLMCERFLKTRVGYGGRAKIVRPFNVYGPGEHTKAEHTRSVVYRLCDAFARVGDVVNDELTPWWDATRDFVFVDDVAAKVKYILENAETVPDVLNFGTGCPTDVVNIVECLESMTGVPADSVLRRLTKSMYSADSYQEFTMALEPFCADMTTMYDGIKTTFDGIIARRSK
jgi:UDP-glucose 4-epimerase